MTVPFLDLKIQYQSIRDEVGQALQAVLDQTAFAGGPFVQRFEEQFAPYCGCAHAVGVGNGTDALWLALLALGVGPGDEVITAVNTFIATAEAISLCGARPVFVDIDQRLHNLDPARLEEAITERTRAIIPVHLYGQMADMDPILEIARSRGLFVVEDASQAHGAEYKGRRAGSLGDLGCFSFYPGKNLGAYGEAGATVTSNTEWAQFMRMFRDHGQHRKYYHQIVGWNGRMDGFQGAVLEVKLRHIEAWTEGRRKNAALYGQALAGIPDIILPEAADWARHVYHIYAIRAPRRDALMEFLKERGVYCAIHYPVPLHLQEAYRHLGYGPGDFPVAERVTDELVSLPMFAELTAEQIAEVADGIRAFYC